MVLEYDFDIVTTEAGETDVKSDFSMPKTKSVRAVFRDARTVEALRATSPKIRKIFQDSGFGLESTRSEISHGYYSRQDAAERERILRTLFANIREMGVKGEYCGEFDFWQFLDDVKTARPRADVSREVPDWTPKPRESAATKPKRRSVQGRIGLALGLAVLVIAILRYLAAAGATL